MLLGRCYNVTESKLLIIMINHYLVVLLTVLQKTESSCFQRKIFAFRIEVKRNQIFPVAYFIWNEKKRQILCLFSHFLTQPLLSLLQS